MYCSRSGFSSCNGFDGPADPTSARASAGEFGELGRIGVSGMSACVSPHAIAAFVRLRGGRWARRAASRGQSRRVNVPPQAVPPRDPDIAHHVAAAGRARAARSGSCGGCIPGRRRSMQHKSAHLPASSVPISRRRARAPRRRPRGRHAARVAAQRARGRRCGRAARAVRMSLHRSWAGRRVRARPLPRLDAQARRGRSGPARRAAARPCAGCADPSRAQVTASRSERCQRDRYPRASTASYARRSAPGVSSPRICRRASGPPAVAMQRIADVLRAERLQRARCRRRARRRACEAGERPHRRGSSAAQRREPRRDQRMSSVFIAQPSERVRFAGFCAQGFGCGGHRQADDRPHALLDGERARRRAG